MHYIVLSLYFLFSIMLNVYTTLPSYLLFVFIFHPQNADVVTHKQVVEKRLIISSIETQYRKNIYSKIRNIQFFKKIDTTNNINDQQICALPLASQWGKYWPDATGTTVCYHERLTTRLECAI